MRFALLVLLLGCDSPVGSDDAGGTDAFVPVDAAIDSEMPDASAPDGGAPDTGDPDAAVDAGPPTVFPGEEWSSSPPEEHGLSTDALRAASADVGDVGGRQCLVVIRDGYLVWEEYFRGDADTQNTAWSVTKSLGAAALGVAVSQGLLSVDDRVADWTDPPFTMDDDAQLRHVLGQVSQSDPAGVGFTYDSGPVVNSLAEAMSNASGMGSGEFARTYLLEPTGMDRGITWAGHDVRFGEGSSGTCRAFARLGWLMANRGVWNGEQLIDESYVDAATSPSFPTVNRGYGYLWWLNGPGHWERPLGVDGEGPMIPEAPESMYFATGLFSQFIFVLPESDTVVVTMGQALISESIANAREMWRALGPALR